MKRNCKDCAFRDALQNLADAVTAVIDLTAKGEHVIASGCDGVYRALCDAKDALQSAAEPTRRGRKKRPAVVNVKKPPTLEELLAYAHGIGYHDDAYTREWHRLMSEEYMWRDKAGRPIKNWPAYFNQWRSARAKFEKLDDPDRIPDARNRVRGQLSNHLETPKEVRDDLLSKCGF